MAETVTSLEGARKKKEKKAKKTKAAKAPKEPKEKANGAGTAGDAGEKKTRKQKTAAPGLVGRDLSNLRATAEESFKELFDLQKDMDADAAGYRSDFAVAYEKIAEKLGVTKTFVTAEYKRALKIKREREKEMMLSDDEAAERETFREMMAGTPMGELFAGDVARPPKAA